MKDQQEMICIIWRWWFSLCVAQDCFSKVVITIYYRYRIISSKWYFEENSVIFSHIVALPEGDTDTEGSTGEKPTCLTAIKKVDFELLLGVMYPV